MSATTIAYRCTQCNKSLRAPIEAAGTTGQCTGCGAIVPIPVVHDLQWPPGACPKPPSVAAPPRQSSLPVGKPVPPTAAPTSPQTIPVATPVQPSVGTPPPAAPVTPSTPASAAPPRIPQPPAYQANAHVPAPLAADESELEMEDYSLDLPPPLPAAPSGPATASPTATRPLPRRRVSRSVGLGVVIARTWEIYKANLGGLVAACIVMLISILGTIVLVGIVFRLLDPERTGQPGDLLPTALSYLPLLALVWLFLGGFTYLVNLARGRDASLGDLFSGGSLLVPAVIVWLMYYVPHFFLMMVCANLGFSDEPFMLISMLSSFGVYYLLWLPTVLVLVDRQVEHPLDVVREALVYVARNILTLAGLLVFSIMLTALGLLACGMGIVFAWPFVVLMLAVCYTSNTREGR